MLRIADTSLTIPHGWQIQMPGELLRAGTYLALQSKVWQYQDAHGETRWNENQLQNCLCKSLPPQADNCSDGRDYYFPDLDALPGFRAKEDHIFGPALWSVLHKKRITEEENPGEWLRRWRALVPCPTCSAHFTNIVNEMPPNFSTDESFLAWSIAAHNQVSKSIGKEEWSLQRAKEFYGY